MKNKYRDFVKDKKIVVSGGTGSFGRTLVKSLLDTDVSEIRILSRDEKKQEEVRFAFSDSRIRFFVGDVRDVDSVTRTIRGADLAFHAAALKQVPSCEFNPLEAVKTNILGASNIIEKVVENELEALVVLSTDKAVYPINVMGTSKAMMEKLAVSKARECFLNNMKTKINVTRYGNVMGSRGSVIPLFINQIKNGLPISLTVPDMTRFMMSLDESVDLVLHAFAEAKQGDVVVRKSPAATILQVAEALLDIFNAKNEIRVIGARHGEKLHETLCSAEEMAVSKDMGEYYQVSADLRDLSNYNSGSGSVGSLIETSYTSSNTQRLTSAELKALLLSEECVASELL